MPMRRSRTTTPPRLGRGNEGADRMRGGLVSGVIEERAAWRLTQLTDVFVKGLRGRVTRAREAINVEICQFRQIRWAGESANEGKALKLQLNSPINVPSFRRQRAGRTMGAFLRERPAR